MTEAEYIEIWRDEHSDPGHPLWCVSLCREDGEEIRCLDTAEDYDDALETGMQEAMGRRVTVRNQGDDDGRTDR